MDKKLEFLTERPNALNDTLRERLRQMKGWTIYDYEAQPVVRNLSNLIVNEMERKLLLSTTVRQFCAIIETIYTNNEMGPHDLAEDFGSEVLFDTIVLLAKENKSIKFGTKK